MSSPSVQTQAIGAGIASMTQLPPSPEIKSTTAAQLPPTSLIPELNLDGLPLTASIPVLSLSTSTTVHHRRRRRLQSVARYQSFQPQALACSTTLAASLSEEELATTPKASSKSTTTTAAASTTITKSAHHVQRDRATLGQTQFPSSLGAIAGPQGVALFRISRPHIPLLILSHATNTKTDNFTSLAFQPLTNTNTGNTDWSYRSTLYLAAARGSGVLLWDASGHRPSPLVGRLSGADYHTMGSSIMARTAVGGGGGTSGTAPTSSSTVPMGDARITSIAWKPSAVAPLLATTTSHTLSLWDLRSSTAGTTVATTTMMNQFKPTLRFGINRRTSGSGSFVQVACSTDSEECAVMDSVGTVRVYDVRMTERGRTGGGLAGGSAPLAIFSAYDTTGVGISYFGRALALDAGSRGISSSSSSSWLTWGLDDPIGTSGVVKIWSSTFQDTAIIDGDMPWFNLADPTVVGTTDTTTTMPLANPNIATQRQVSLPDYALIAQYSRPNLACARVCPSPLERSFVVVGHTTGSAIADDNILTAVGNDDKIIEGGSWWAELHQLNGSTPVMDTEGKSQSISDRTNFGLCKVEEFQGGNTADSRPLASIVNNSGDWGELQAAELAFCVSSSSAFSSIRQQQVSREEHISGGIDDNEEETNELELLLCCLSDTGIVTTHVSTELSRTFALSSAQS